MSISVKVEELESHVDGYARGAYVLVSTVGGPPRVTHSSIRFEGTELVVAVGRQSAAALGANPELCILWPATDDQSMSLIVDATVRGEIDPDGGDVRVTPTSAVHHRPAPR